MAASGMGLCRQCTFFNKRYGFIGARYGFQSKCSFQRLTPVDPPGESSRWGVPAVAPAMLHVTTTPHPGQTSPATLTWAVFWPMGHQSTINMETGYGFGMDFEWIQPRYGFQKTCEPN